MVRIVPQDADGHSTLKGFEREEVLDGVKDLQQKITAGGLNRRQRHRESIMAYYFLTDDDYAEFERLFQAFVSRGGLDSTRCVNEAYEIMERERIKSKPTHCPHGLTRLTCSHCYLNDTRGDWGGWWH